jgi:hypothetical protein
MRARHFSINYVIYPFTLFVSVLESDDTVIRQVKTLVPEDMHDELAKTIRASHSCANTIQTPAGLTLIRFREEPSAGLIAHEALHAVEFVMDYIRNDEVNEAWNYLLQYIVNEITSKISRP